MKRTRKPGLCRADWAIHIAGIRSDSLVRRFHAKLGGIMAAFGPASFEKTAELIYSARLPLRS